MERVREAYEFILNEQDEDEIEGCYFFRLQKCEIIKELPTPKPPAHV